MSTRQKAASTNKPRKAKLKIRSSKNAPAKTSYQLDINRATEEWLGTLEQKIKYDVWYCGHYHIDKQIDKIDMMYKEIRPLHPL